MSLIPWRPFRDIDKWFSDWDIEDWPFLEKPIARVPRMDIYERDNDVVAKVELPGVDPKDINVEVKDNVLRVEAKTEEKKEEKKKGYFKKEIRSGYFHRAVALPVDVEENKAQATYEDGILEVVIPKKVEKKSKKGIKIKVKTKK